MRSARYISSAAALLALLLIVPVVASCGGSVLPTELTASTTKPTAGETTTASPQTTATTAPTGTTAATTAPSSDTTAASAYDALAEIRAALEASDQIAVDFQITESKIVDDEWAGVVITAPNTDGAFVLLSHGEGTWSIVTLGSGLTHDDLYDLGAPQAIVDMLGPAAPALTLSDKAVAYAETLGGISHQGQDLYVIVGASLSSEQEAQAALDQADPLFGDMQPYYIIQLSDNFDGLEPGWYVIIEAYENDPSAENMEFGRRGFPDAYVKAVTVKTADPIPVYEDQVGG